MKVRIQVSIAGHAEPLYGLPDFSFTPGDVVELHKDLAKAWLACGHAERIITRPPAAPAVDDTQPQDAQGSD